MENNKLSAALLVAIKALKTYLPQSRSGTAAYVANFYDGGAAAQEALASIGRIIEGTETHGNGNEGTIG